MMEGKALIKLLDGRNYCNIANLDQGEPDLKRSFDGDRVFQ